MKIEAKRRERDIERVFQMEGFMEVQRICERERERERSRRRRQWLMEERINNCFF